MRLQVADLARSIAYYTTIVGFGVHSQTASVAVLGPHDDHSTALLELHERPGARPVSPRGLLGLYHFAILVPDRASLGRFVAHLAASDGYAGSADHWVSEALYLTDPDGLGIEVYADRPRSTWQTNGRELAMSTEPLDLAALARAGGGQPWSGLPAGTVIGHVHLYVGDITAAEAFYHSALGFDKTVWSYPGALFMSAGGYHHHLGSNTWAKGARPATDADARLLEWEIVMPAEADIEDAVRSVTAAGYRANEGDGNQLTDPWGTRLRLTHPREGRGLDRPMTE